VPKGKCEGHCADMHESWAWSTTVCQELHSSDEFYENPTHFLLADNYVTDGRTSSSSYGFIYLFLFLLRKECLTVLYLRLRVMCSDVPSYQYGGRVPVTPHAIVAPHCVQPFVAMHVRILPAACLFAAFFSFVTICIPFHRLLSWVRIPYCFVGESSCEVGVASNPVPMFKRKN